MTRYNELVQAIIDGRVNSRALTAAFAAIERAIAALENPTTEEERRVLVRALVDYSNTFDGSIEGPDLDARTRWRARQRAFEAAQQLAVDDPVRAEASVKLGMALLVDEPARAEQLIREGLRVMDTTDGASKVWLINARENLGLALLRLERWADAADVLDDARRAWLAGPPDAPPDRPTGSLFFNQGLAWLRLEQWTEARGVLQEAVTLNRREFEEDHPNTIEAELHHAMALVELGDYDNARPTLERVSKVVRDKAGESHRLYRLANEYLDRCHTGRK